MPLLLRDPRVSALMSAQQYEFLAAQHQSLQAQLASLDEQLGDAYTAALRELRAAFAACPTTAAWEDLYASLAQRPAVATLLEALPLPGPRDGSIPPTLAES